MFIEKARQLEFARSRGGIVIDHNNSLKASHGTIFSMTGDGQNNVAIPLVLIFKDEAFQLLHLLSREPNLIVYLGDERRLEESFYHQLDFLESLLPPFNQTSRRWNYGEPFARWKFCPIVPSKLKPLELSMRGTQFEAAINAGA